MQTATKNMTYLDRARIWTKATVYRCPAAGCRAVPQMHSEDTEK